MGIGWQQRGEGLLPESEFSTNEQFMYVSNGTGGIHQETISLFY